MYSKSVLQLVTLPFLLFIVDSKDPFYLECSLFFSLHVDSAFSLYLIVEIYPSVGISLIPLGNTK